MVTLPYKSPAREGGKEGEREAGATGGGAEGRDGPNFNGEECKEPNLKSGHFFSVHYPLVLYLLSIITEVSPRSH